MLNFTLQVKARTSRSKREQASAGGPAVALEQSGP